MHLHVRAHISAYDNYPVVNITQEAAQTYCNWLTANYKTSDLGLQDHMQIGFKLPTRTDWLHAASGGKTGPYAWGGPLLHSKLQAASREQCSPIFSLMAPRTSILTRRQKPTR
jgi:formylglycine-generating enzyme required for sulfatase activity